jgi:two-component system, sensor histidine kinase RpfC
LIEAIRNFVSALTPEQEILFNRVVLGSFAATACYFLGFDARIIAAFIGYLFCNSILFLMQRGPVLQPQTRWLLGILLDITMAATTMTIDAQGMSWAYGLILWMILGNGFHHGVKWLAIASILSAFGFGCVVANTSYWQQNYLLGCSLVACLIVIPAYCSTLIRKISHTKDQAEAANRAKSYFLASVSHELRTPLNAILGYGNHLRGLGLPRKQHNMIDASVLAAEHLLHLIEQLIHVAKTEVGSSVVQYESFKATSLLTEVRDIMANQVDEKGLDFKLQAKPHCDGMLNGPVDIIRNILLNLIGNAVKFTDSGSISISIDISERNTSSVLAIKVSDTGIGIAEGALAKIFQPFQQADDSVMDRFGGTGLGLAICKQLADQVSGSINVNSVIGQGSQFEVMIPVERVNETELATEQTNNETVRILSLGQFKPELLASAQSLDNFAVHHVDCTTAAELNRALEKMDLNKYKIALIDERIAKLLNPDDLIWTNFADAQLAAVLVRASDTADFEDVSLTAAFASIIPPSPDFQTLRSAIHIGCSFAGQSLNESETIFEERKSSPSRNVLVADDNRTNRNVLAAILETAGHVATLVTDGDEALDALEQGGFDILLLDVNMPRLNGIDAAAMWRQIEGGRSHLPIIGVTADATAETEARCLAAGMDIRVSKPFDSKKLLTLIDQYTIQNIKLVATDTTHDPIQVVVPIVKPASEDKNIILDHDQIAYLRSIGDDTFLIEMINSFQSDMEETVEPMRQSIAQQDFHQFRFCAHAFKSSANNIGAYGLAQICGKLEHITEAEFEQNAAKYLSKIESELSQVEAALNDIVVSPDQIATG